MTLAAWPWQVGIPRGRCTVEIGTSTQPGHEEADPRGHPRWRRPDCRAGVRVDALYCIVFVPCCSCPAGRLLFLPLALAVVFAMLASYSPFFCRRHMYEGISATRPICFLIRYRFAYAAHA